jgi:hypothetical protein
MSTSGTSARRCTAAATGSSFCSTAAAVPTFISVACTRSSSTRTCAREAPRSTVLLGGRREEGSHAEAGAGAVCWSSNGGGGGRVLEWVRLFGAGGQSRFWSVSSTHHPSRA